MSMEQLTPIIQTATSFLVALSGLLAILGAFSKTVRHWITKKFTDSEERRKEAEDKRKEAQAIKDALELMNLRLDDFKTELAKDREEKKLLKDALVGMMRDRLNTIYNQADTRGYIETRDRENFVEMYDIYRSLGGNHYVQDLYEKIKTMPGKPPRRASRKVMFWTGDSVPANAGTKAARTGTRTTRARTYTRA